MNSIPRKHDFESFERSYLCRGLAVFLMLNGSASLLAAESLAPTRIQLIDDTRFESGFTVWSATAGSHVKEGVIQPGDSGVEPSWGLAQWHSRFSLAKVHGDRMADQSIRFFDGAKSVTFFPASSQADISFGVNGQTEYRGKAPLPGAAWPHLLAERKLLVHPRIDTLKELRLAISFRLVKADVARPDGFDTRRHTAQFQLFLTVQNQNRSSTGHGDYLWFGVPMFDQRYASPPAHKAADRSTDQKKGTGKFIFSIAGEKTMQASAHDGKWVTIDVDLLPHVLESLQTAWARGFLPDSQDRSDYRLGGMNLGWEVTGPIDVEMQVRGFQLEAQVPRQ